MFRQPGTPTLLAVLAALTGLAGCSAASRGPSATGFVAAVTGDGCDPVRDRQAIRAMAGGFEVKFDFTETVALAEGYQLKPPYRVGASELVILAEDDPQRIALQHILVVGEGDKR